MDTENLNKPLYVQIQEYIAEMILSGQMAPETKLPSEREFSHDLGVSRMTVRRSITELVNEGLLERRHGSGTYVAKPRLTFDARELISYIQAMQTRGIATASQLLEFGQVPASRRLSERLAVEIGDPLYRVILLRLANRIPFVLERYFFPASRLPNLEEYDLEKTSILTLLVEGYSIQFAHISQTIEAVAASETVAQQLRVEDGFPLLMVTRTILRKGDDEPVQYAQDFLRSDYVRIHSDLVW
ncbi:MAG: GntR family transcriptional regulator [Chloroflexi bacterium]|nr:GntR family transcriptional regulator [Chloroflexota bacterium]